MNIYHSFSELKKEPYSSVYKPSENYINMRKKLDEQKKKLEENKKSRRKFPDWDSRFDKPTNILFLIYRIIAKEEIHCSRKFHSA